MIGFPRFARDFVMVTAGAKDVVGMGNGDGSEVPGATGAATATAVVWTGSVMVAIVSVGGDIEGILEALVSCSAGIVPVVLVGVSGAVGDDG